MPGSPVSQKGSEGRLKSQTNWFPVLPGTGTITLDELLNLFEPVSCTTKWDGSSYLEVTQEHLSLCHLPIFSCHPPKCKLLLRMLFPVPLPGLV